MADNREYFRAKAKEAEEKLAAATTETEREYWRLVLTGFRAAAGDPVPPQSPKKRD